MGTKLREQNPITHIQKKSYLIKCGILNFNSKKFKNFQNWSKILKVQKSFITYKWGIMYMMC